MTSGKQYKLGIALSGGSARGFAHVGALKAIEEAGLKPDVLAGVSAGSIVAVLYASGVSPDNILKLFSDQSLKSLIGFNLKSGGIFNIDKMKQLIMKAIAPCKTFADLKIPVYIGVTNLDTGKWEVMNEGTIADRMVASCSIPILFKPVNINGSNYVDGGVLRNLPSSAIRDKCETLIGINVNPMTPLKKPNSIIDIALRTYDLMAKSNQNPDMEICDLAVVLREISSYQLFNLNDINKVFTSGYLNMRRSLREADMWKSHAIPDGPTLPIEDTDN